MINKTIKLTFTGDAMVLLPELKASARTDSSFQFDSILSDLKPLLTLSDYVCANLETPLAGAEMGYTSTATSFNTPVEFALALRDTGINCVTTANNHTLDRGTEGLIRTLDALDSCGLDHTGTYRSRKESDIILIREFDGIRIAILSCTYGTNSEYNGCFLPEDKQYMIDLLKRQAHAETLDPIIRQTSTLQKVKTCLAKPTSQLFSSSTIEWLRQKFSFLQDTSWKKIVDNVPDSEIGKPEHEPYLVRFDKKIQKARALADYVVVCAHFGGQYNDRIGRYTHNMMEHSYSQGVDLVVGNHPHCILPAKIFSSDKFGVYALGNLYATPYWGYWADGAFSEYSILLHIYIDTATRQISHSTFTVIKTEQDSDGHSRVRPVTDILSRENRPKRRKALERELEAVFARLTGNTSHPKVIDGEYLLVKNNVNI